MNLELQAFSDALAATVASAGEGVVRVDARHRMSASGIVWAADGVIVSAQHVVERDADIRIGLPDGGEVPASLAGRDPTDRKSVV